MTQTTMSSNTPIQVRTEGLIIELTIMGKGKAVDISSATTKQIIIKPPIGDNITKTATFSSDGTDGKLRCVTVDDDLGIAGNYQTQAYVELINFTGFSSITSFQVVDNL